MITPWENAYADLDDELPVEVYRNTNRKGIVYTIRQGGYVVAHCDEVHLVNAEFHVSEKGRKRVKKTKQKNVHAWIRGEIVKECGALRHPYPITYNPLKHKTFVRLDTNRPVHKAPFVTLGQKGVWADNTVML